MANAQRPEPLLAPARIDRLAGSQAPVWHAYVARSRATHARDTASMNAELRAVGRDTMERAPYVAAFEVGPTMTPAWLATDSARRVADNVLSFQAPNGGWSKHVDFARGPRRLGQSYFGESNGWSWISTIDNGATTEELRFLALMNAARPDGRYRAAYVRGLDYLLAAQMPNGCWPQSYPLDGSYHDAATLNDGATVNVLRALDDGADEGAAFVPPASRVRARSAAARGIDCLLRAQVVTNGVPTVWGQQHDPLTLAPTSARSYELTSLSGMESAEVVRYLMRLPSPDARVVAAVHAAVDWFSRTAIRGSAYDDFELRAEPNAGPLWARLYEIGTDRPIFSNRDGVRLYNFDQLTDRRRGYAWFTTAPVAMLRQYERWATKHPRPHAEKVRKS